MFDTGNLYFNIFIHISAYLPIVPFLIILIRQSYTQVHMNYLMIVSLVTFMYNILLNFIPFYSEPFHLLRNVLGVTELVFILLIIQTHFNSEWGRQMLIVLLLFVPIMSITFMLINTPNQLNTTLLTIDSFIIFIVAILFLNHLLQHYHKNITGYNLFWITAGICLYFGCYLVLNMGRKFIFKYDDKDYKIMWMVMYAANFIKFAFFVIAAILSKPGFMQPYGEETIQDETGPVREKDPDEKKADTNLATIIPGYSSNY